MNESIKVIDGYKLLLRYNQNCWYDIGYGLTDLYYKINGSTPFIRKIDHTDKSEMEFESHIEDRSQNEKTVLENYLIGLMSYRYNFEGEPIYENSEIFSVEAFAALFSKGLEKMELREDQARILN